MFKKFFNATFTLFVAYFICHVMYLVVRYVALNILGIEEAALYFTSVYYDPLAYESWSKSRIFLVYGLPSFSMILIAFVSLTLYLKTEKENLRMKVFYMWLFLVSLSFLLADIFKAPFIRGDLASVYEWFYLKKEFAFLIAILAFLPIPFIASKIDRVFLKTADSRYWIKSKMNRTIYFFNKTLLPLTVVFILFSVIVLVVPSYQFNNLFKTEIIRFFTLSLFLILGAYFAYSKKFIEVKKINDFQLVSKSKIALVTLFVITVYILLWFSF